MTECIWYCAVKQPICKYTVSTNLSVLIKVWHMHTRTNLGVSKSIVRQSVCVTILQTACELVPVNAADGQL